MPQRGAGTTTLPMGQMAQRAQVVFSREILGLWLMPASGPGNESALSSPNRKSFFLQCLLWDGAGGYGAVQTFGLLCLDSRDFLWAQCVLFHLKAAVNACD